MTVCDRKTPCDNFVLGYAIADNIGGGIEPRKIGFGHREVRPSVGATSDHEYQSGDDDCHEAASYHLTRYIGKFVFNCEQFLVYFWASARKQGDVEMVNGSWGSTVIDRRYRKGKTSLRIEH
jgi:hypothetical protein